MFLHCLWSVLFITHLRIVGIVVFYFYDNYTVNNSVCTHAYMYCFMCVLYCTGCLWRTPSKDRVPGRFCGVDLSKHTWRYGGVIVVAVCVCVCSVCVCVCVGVGWACYSAQHSFAGFEQKNGTEVAELTDKGCNTRSRSHCASCVSCYATQQYFCA